jgi:archaeosortase A (PGF-CTERM-specific)
MLDRVLGALEWLTTFSDPLAWVVIAAFTFAAGLAWYDREGEPTRLVAVAAWVLFAAFWLTQIYHFAFVQKSIVEGIGTLVAVPGALYVAYLIAGGRESLYVLTRAIAIMGLVFLPFEALALFRRPLVEAVTRQTEFLMNLIGYSPQVVNGEFVNSVVDSPQGQVDPYRNTFFWKLPDGHQVTYTIKIACTGIGSMAIFAGLIGAVRAPWRRKAAALALSIPVIYALNLVRNVFIGLSFGKQYLQIAPDLVMTLFASADPYKVSFFVADRILAQSMSVVALVAITWLVVREVPEVLIIIEDLLFMATGSEWDLRGALGVRPVRADGK